MKNIYKTLGYLECILTIKLEVKELNEKIKSVYDKETSEELLLIYKAPDNNYIINNVYSGKEFYKKQAINLAIEYLRDLQEDKHYNFKEVYDEKIKEVINYIQLKYKSMGLYIEEEISSEHIDTTILDSKTYGKELYISIAVYNSNFNQTSISVIRNKEIENGNIKEKIKNIINGNKN